MPPEVDTGVSHSHYYCSDWLGFGHVTRSSHILLLLVAIDFLYSLFFARKSSALDVVE